jgi:hypothetical protein
LAKNNMAGRAGIAGHTGIGVRTHKGDAGSSATALCWERRILLEERGLPCLTARLQVHRVADSVSADWQRTRARKGMGTNHARLGGS